MKKQKMDRVLRENEELDKSSNHLKSVVALALYFGGIHFTLAIILLALFFLPLSKALLVFGFLVLLIVLPVDKNSLFGKKLSRFICKHICNYFPITLHLEDPEAFHLNRPYVFCYEPHSIYPFGIFALHENVGLMPISNIRHVVGSTALNVPFMRQVWTWLGYTSVEKKNILSILAAGDSCLIIPGGVREKLFIEHGSENVFLKDRKGIVRIAMETGHPLVPVFCFGQTNTYKLSKVSQKLARYVNIMPLIFWGIAGSPIPFKNPLYVVVGKPLQLEKNPNPTTEQVAKIHSEFIEALQHLFERHKTQAGFSNLELKIL